VSSFLGFQLDMLINALSCYRMPGPYKLDWHAAIDYDQCLWFERWTIVGLGEMAADLVGAVDDLQKLHNSYEHENNFKSISCWVCF